MFADMSDEKDIRETLREEKRSEKTGKYKPLRRNRQTEIDALRIFQYGTERELMQFLRENGLNDDSPRFAELVKLFREHGRKQR
jgi:hypothetical protein